MMSAICSQHSLDVIDDMTSNIVKGYIHKIESVLSQNHVIPKDVIQLFLLFYFEPTDQFNANLDGEHISLIMEKNRLITAQKLVARNSPWESVYGSLVIDPVALKDHIIKWKIKCHALHQKVYFSIGIVAVIEMNDVEMNQYCFNKQYYIITNIMRGLEIHINK